MAPSSARASSSTGSSPEANMRPSAADASAQRPPSLARATSAATASKSTAATVPRRSRRVEGPRVGLEAFAHKWRSKSIR